jgi:hypothetical protein
VIQSLLKQNGFEQIEFETVHTVHKSGVSYPIFSGLSTTPQALIDFEARTPRKQLFLSVLK